MWKYIITWCVLIEVSLPSKPVKDEFGRSSTSVDLLYRYTIEEDCNHSKEFFNRKDAFKFYTKAYKEQADTLKSDSNYIVFEHGGNLKNVKIDSIYVELN